MPTPMWPSCLNPSGAPIITLLTRFLFTVVVSVSVPDVMRLPSATRGADMRLLFRRSCFIVGRPSLSLSVGMPPAAVATPPPPVKPAMAVGMLSTRISVSGVLLLSTRSFSGV